MIKSISIANTATYGNQPAVLGELSKFNYVFGFNGTGKTTIGRIIANEDAFDTCAVNWERGSRLDAFVYNRDFIDRNFGPSSKLKGVFTLGEKVKGAKETIDERKKEVDDLQGKISGLIQNLEGENGISGKKGELTQLINEFEEKCWVQKIKHDEKLKGAFEGYRNSKVKFGEKVLKERENNKADLIPLVELEKSAESVFASAPTKAELIPVINADHLITDANNPVLKKRVIGKEDVGIAEMIKKLNNSDWVKQGRVYYDKNDRLCPFCQQYTTEAFERDLNEYFDESYEKDITAISSLVTKYKP